MTAHIEMYCLKIHFDYLDYYSVIGTLNASINIGAFKFYKLLYI